LKKVPSHTFAPINGECFVERRKKIEGKSLLYEYVLIALINVYDYGRLIKPLTKRKERRKKERRRREEKKYSKNVYEHQMHFNDHDRVLSTLKVTVTNAFELVQGRRALVLYMLVRITLKCMNPQVPWNSIGIFCADIIFGMIGYKIKFV
jgi:hypothetical protein